MRRPLPSIFVATRPEQVPASCQRILSVDGCVPGALVTWDHHVTGEPINLDAMPDEVDLAQFDAIGTTLADTDALASVVAALFGGRARLAPSVRGVLEAASYRCDHLLPHPHHGGEVDRLGGGLHAFASTALAQRSSAGKSAEFGRLCRLVARRIEAGRGFPRARLASFRAVVRRLTEGGRLHVRDGVLLIDLRGDPTLSGPPEAWYRARPDCVVAVIADDHPDGGSRYTVGRNPLNPAAPTDVRPALAALAAAEFAHGAPALAPDTSAAAANWGGRQAVGGSPWNYASRLTADEVMAITAAAVLKAGSS